MLTVQHNRKKHKKSDLKINYSTATEGSTKPKFKVLFLFEFSTQADLKQLSTANCTFTNLLLLLILQIPDGNYCGHQVKNIQNGKPDTSTTRYATAKFLNHLLSLINYYQRITFKHFKLSSHAVQCFNISLPKGLWPPRKTKSKEKK